MLQFKTVALPATEVTVKGKDMYTVETANKVLAPIGQAIQNEAKGGWSLHSYVVIPATVHRKKGIVEKLLGWIPIIGPILGFLCGWNRHPDVINPEYYSLIFVKEV
jgi:hypothetical protein